MADLVDRPADDAARRSPDELEPIEVASREEIAALQLSRLKWSLRHAYDNVAHYRTAFDQAGVHPSDLKDLADLALFPFTTKADLRQNYPFGMFAVPQSEVRRLHASSGTTGHPTVVGYTTADIDTWANLVARSLRAAGVRSADKVHIAYGYGLFTGGIGAHYGAERLGCTVIPMSGGMTERQIQLINDFEPDAIMVTPSYMLTLIDAMERAGIDPRETSLRTGVFGAEPWTERMRAELEHKLGIDAVDIYGLSEVIGPGVAQECVETKDGLHIWEDHFYPEIIDPGNGRVLPDGSEGELVFTSLTKQAFPIIRYRTRDLTALLPGTARSMRRIRQDHRPHRRHGDPARCQPLPDPDRGADLRGAGPDTGIPLRSRPDRPTRHPHRARGVPNGFDARDACGRRRDAHQADQEPHRRQRDGQCCRAEQHGALRRKGEAVDRQPAQMLTTRHCPWLQWPANRQCRRPRRRVPALDPRIDQHHLDADVPNGNSATPTAARAWRPTFSPNTCTAVPNSRRSLSGCAADTERSSPCRTP